MQAISNFVHALRNQINLDYEMSSLTVKVTSPKIKKVSQFYDHFIKYIIYKPGEEMVSEKNQYNQYE